MAADTTEVLCTGDLHLGRQPSRIPEGMDALAEAPRTVWKTTVDRAIAESVDAVLVTGDVADRKNRYFEAYGAFEPGALRLDEAGIPTVLVSGNHDFDSLPRMVEDMDLDSQVLLGEGGEWERHTLQSGSGQPLHIDGWSFPGQHVHESPLETCPTGDDVDGPRLGLLHADLDAPQSRYAPIRSDALRESGADAWLLGHIHSPAVQIKADPFVLYPGSPQGLDPGERGCHGPWHLQIGSDGGIDATQIPLAPVWYDTLEVDVTGVDDVRGTNSRIRDRIESYLDEQPHTGPLELFLTRIRLTGRTDVHGELVAHRSELQGQLGHRVGSVDVRIESITVDTQPAIDLQSRAGTDDPVAVLAGLLLDLEEDGSDTVPADLLGGSVESMRDAYHAGAFNTLRREGEVEEPTREDATAVLKAQGRLLLDALLQQKEDER